MSYATAHPLYVPCLDLPELASGAVIEEIDRDLETIVAAVAARTDSDPCAIVQEKVDGCWCALVIDSRGRIASATARSGLPLRQAVEWTDDGERRRRIDPAWAGWTIVCEVEAGSSRASERRTSRERRGYYGPPPAHVLELVAPDGTRHVGLAKVGPLLWQMLPGADATSHWHRMQPVREPMPGQSAADFVRAVMESGGEGIVVRDASGCYRAKPIVDADRVVLRVVSEQDRNGQARTKVIVGYCACNGARRSQFRATQKVAMPRSMARRIKRGVVVTVAGAHLDRSTGIVRHGRIVEVREPEDKLATECKKRG